MVSRTRGRPPKFGRPARLIALTLPEDTIQELQSLDPDIAKAVVALVDRSLGRTTEENGDWQAPIALVQVGESRALIVVDPSVYRAIPGCTIVPLSDRRAFLALEPGRSLADLELTITDLLEEEGAGGTDRDALLALRQALRAWRRDDTLSFHARSIVFVERGNGWRS